jgi:hypothetical protein
MANAWQVRHLDVICALTGESVVKIEVAQKSVAEVKDEVNIVLGSKFLFHLVDGVNNIEKMMPPQIRGPLKLIKLRERGLPTYCLHEILVQMGQMDGSRNVTRLLAKVDKDPDKMAMESMAKYYERLFKDTTEGYILQARMLQLYALHTSAETPSKEAVLAVLRNVHRTSAIALLFEMHNQFAIELDQVRFRALAVEGNIFMR